MTDVLVIIGVNIFVEYFQSIFEFALQFLCDQLNHLRFLYFLELGRTWAYLSKESDFVDIEVCDASTVNLVLDFQVPSFHFFVSKNQYWKGIY